MKRSRRCAACCKRSWGKTDESELAVLRITIDKKPDALVLRLEGRLEGPWVAVLAQSFRRAQRNRRDRRLCVDLSGITFVDAQGKAQLTSMCAQGTELFGEDLETRAIVTEIVASVRNDNGRDR